ncbi:MAG: glycine--tRNA ligase subunit beta [Deltaproteobacteria bacterium]|nr:glycine--tRNA ligase subunit beta [Deltaproteobacteria bacterium]
MNGEFLLEIGTEEIPSGYLNDGLADLLRLAKSSLHDYRIRCDGELATHGTPRRMVLVGKGLASSQDDMVQDITGPPKKAAYDEKGNPTKAAIGFAKKQGVSVDDLGLLEMPKGEYLHVKRTVPGKPTVEVLSEILPKLISGINWPKSMRWGSVGFPFVRPVHWVLALFNGEVIPFEIAGVKGSNRTRGHRFMARGVIEIRGYSDYCEQMHRNGVMIDLKERTEAVEKAVRAAAEEISGQPMMDEDLLNTVTNLVEYPYAVCGGFDQAFLDLPEPVLITPMKEHQKYFPVYDPSGRLMPNFIAVNNTRPNDAAVVQKGHERVLRARLADADFFFKEDRKRPLEDRLEDLKEVIYQAELGTSHAKVERFTRLAEYLAGQVGAENLENVRLAARLCKCDLVTEMVMEFPSLQGVMGKEYARLDGHAEEICGAIREHYLPARAGGALPETAIGAIVGVADRMDTISGCFAVNLVPTGAADPFALRRHALAIIRIMEDRAWDISLKSLIRRSLSILGETIPFDQDQVFNQVHDFFKERFRNMMLRSDYESDLVEAIITARFDRIHQLKFRMDALKKFMTNSNEFESLVLTFKRVTNILKRQEKMTAVDPALFRESCETDLWNAFQKLKEEAGQSINARDYLQALNLMGQLRKPVDAFFDGVEVLTKEDAALRENRIGVLHNVAGLFLRMADFSKFSI